MKKAKRILPVIFLLIVAVFAVTAFSACIDADSTVQRTKLEDLGYTVANGSAESVDGCIECLVAAKNEDVRAEYEYVRIYYFDTEDDAQEFFYGEFQERLERLREDPQYEFLGGVDYKIVGNIVVYGTPGGVEDAFA